MAMKAKRLIPLSVQQLIDCGDHDFQPNEGWHEVNYDVFKEGGLESEEAYPYRGLKKKGDKCHLDKNRIVAKVDYTYDRDETYKFALGEGQTAELLQEGPLANGINARARSFQFYSKGTIYKSLLLL